MIVHLSQHIQPHKQSRNPTKESSIPVHRLVFVSASGGRGVAFRDDFALFRQRHFSLVCKQSNHNLSASQPKTVARLCDQLT
ncbi:hypothetical protein IAQ61_007298 [Plenodomus lingam]|uniref:uncharacterized protein n=1 Tax=Leptosphaeria maculans TaxID=5022 RepID=UPI0033309EA9|nr:hypothetical protein IAQ61_007298 [Plenodomus lingam]